MDFRNPYITSSFKAVWYFILAILLLVLTIPALTDMPLFNNGESTQLGGVAFIAICGIAACIISFYKMCSKR